MSDEETRAGFSGSCVYPIALVIIPGVVVASFGLLLPQKMKRIWIGAATISSLGFYLSTRDFDGGGPFDGAMGITVMTVVIFGVVAGVMSMTKTD